MAGDMSNILFEKMSLYKYLARFWQTIFKILKREPVLLGSPVVYCTFININCPLARRFHYFCNLILSSSFLRLSFFARAVSGSHPMGVVSIWINRRLDLFRRKRVESIPKIKTKTNQWLSITVWKGKGCWTIVCVTCNIAEQGSFLFWIKISGTSRGISRSQIPLIFKTNINQNLRCLSTWKFEHILFQSRKL